jgi:hypothetical protein
LETPLNGNLPGVRMDAMQTMRNDPNGLNRRLYQRFRGYSRKNKGMAMYWRLCIEMP